MKELQSRLPQGLDGSHSHFVLLPSEEVDTASAPHGALMQAEGSLPKLIRLGLALRRSCGGKDCSKPIWETLTGRAHELCTRAVPEELDLSLAWH